MTEAATIDLHQLVAAHGGELYDGGRRAILPGPGHSKRDRSLSIRLTEEGRALIHSFAGDAFAECAKYLGLQNARPAGGSNQAERDRIKRAREAEERKRAAILRDFCAEVWRGSADPAASPVETYLKSRGLPGKVPAMEVRFHDRAPFGYARKTYTPAMIAAVRGPNGEAIGLHITALTMEGRKAFGDRSRIMCGQVQGGAVRLSPAGDALAVAEGIETAQSFAHLVGTPTWATLSTAGLRAFSPPPSVKRLTIAADADDSGAGMEAARELAERTSRKGVHVTILPAPDGQDWNDVLRGGAQ